MELWLFFMSWLAWGCTPVRFVPFQVLFSFRVVELTSAGL